MKLALLTNFIPPYRLSLYEEIDRLFDDFQIFISTGMEKNRNWDVDYKRLNVTIQKSISYTKNWENELGFSEKTSVQLPWDTYFQLRKHKVDAVISGEMGLRSFLASIYCSWHKKPLILWLTLSEHTETNKTGIRKYLRKYILSKSAAVLCNGKSGERYVRSLGFKDSIFFAPYTIDYKSTTKEKFNLRKKILLSGQLIERKGIKELMAALKALLDRNSNLYFDLIVAGDGPQKELFKSLENNDQIQLSMLGTVEYHKLKELYKTVDLFLFPTLADEWGVVVNEALSSGLPVIGSKYSQAVEELVKENKNGWIFDPLNQKEFIDVLERAIKTEHDTLLKMSSFAAESTKSVSPSIVAQTIREAIQHVIKT